MAAIPKTRHRYPAGALLAALLLAACSDSIEQPAPEMAANPAPAGAFGGATDGRLLYERACASCHDEGFNGAPRPVAGDWPFAAELGVEHYTQSAILGIGIMPARGGRPDMTDEQVQAAVEFMLDGIVNRE